MAITDVRNDGVSRTGSILVTPDMANRLSTNGKSEVNTLNTTEHDSKQLNARLKQLEDKSNKPTVLERVINAALAFSGGMFPTAVAALVKPKEKDPEDKVENR